MGKLKAEMFVGFVPLVYKTLFVLGRNIKYVVYVLFSTINYESYVSMSSMYTIVTVKRNSDTQSPVKLRCHISAANRKPLKPFWSGLAVKAAG